MLHNIFNQKKIQIIAQHLQDTRILGLLLFLAIILMITWNSIQTIETNYGIQQQIETMKQQNKVQDLANENVRLQNEYYRTDQYLDIAARQHFGLAAVGENVLAVSKTTALSHTVAALEPEAEEDDAPKTQTPSYQDNFQAWMDFFLHRDH